jgi:FixJ family two-component response regulator
LQLATEMLALKPGVPLAVISANHQVEVVTRTREVGATFLQKPLTERALGEFAADAAKRLSAAGR